MWGDWRACALHSALIVSLFLRLPKCNCSFPSVQEEAESRAGSTALTWALLDTESPIGVLGIVVVLQLEGGGVVHKGLGALCDTSTTVIEVHTGLQKGETTDKGDKKNILNLIILLL